MSTTITTSGVGLSDKVTLDPGTHLLVVKWAGNPGVADLQVSGDGTTFVPVLADGDEAVVIDMNWSRIAVGGVHYRLNVSKHTSPATLSSFNTGT